MAMKGNKSQEIADNIIKSIENRTAPWLKPWTPEQCGMAMPHNPVSGTRYKGINILHLLSQGKSDPRWATFKQAASKQWSIKKGSKGVTVQFWQFTKQEDKRDKKGKPVKDELGKPVKKTVRLERPILRHYYVFNGEQINGIPLLEQPKTKEKNAEWEINEKVENIFKNSKADIEHVRGDRACYSPSKDKIVLPEKDQFDTSNKYYATALHELGHWTGHESRLDRTKFHAPYGTPTYAREELRAEIASFIMGVELEIGHDPGQHMAYIDSWVKDLKDRPTEIFKACSDAEKINSFIMDFEKEREINMEHQAEQQPQQQAEKSIPQNHSINNGEPKQFISFVANVRQENEFHDTTDITFVLDLADKNKSQNKSNQVVKFKNAVVLDEEDDIPSVHEVRKQNIDGIVINKNGKPITAITTDRKVLYKGMFQAAAGEEKNYLNIPFAEKNAAKDKGALWDGKVKSWYIAKGLDKTEFSQWQNTQTNQVTTGNPQQQFADFIQSMGGNLNGDLPIMDGKIHRIPELSKAGNKNLSYVGYLDGRPAGYVKNHHSNAEQKWKMEGATLTQENRQRIAKEGQERKIQREKERDEVYSKKAIETQGILKNLKKATGQEVYFQKKGIEIKDTIAKIDQSGKIYLPLQDTNGKVWSYQSYQANGFKQLPKESKLQGNFGIIGGKNLSDIKGDILIAEGYSTAATIHEVTKQPVIVAVTVNNLPEVAKALKNKFPDKAMHIMADNDKNLPLEGRVNAGVAGAEKAAKATGAKIHYPNFGKQVGKDKTDFNDMARLQGKEATRKHIEASLRLANIATKITKEKQAEVNEVEAKEINKEEQRVEQHER